MSLLKENLQRRMGGKFAFMEITNNEISVDYSHNLLKRLAIYCPNTEQSIPFPFLQI